MSTIKTNQLAHTANGASVFTLPQTDGSANQVLKTDGSATLSFATPLQYIEYSTQAVGGANTYSTTITGNPKYIEVSLYKVRHVDNQNIMYRLSTSAAEISSGYMDISYSVKDGASSVSNTVRGFNQAQGCLVNYNFTGVGNLISGEAKFTRVAAGLYTWQGIYDFRYDSSVSNNAQYLLTSGGHIADFSSSGSGNVTQFRIFTNNGGNFTSGQVTVRGIV